MPLASLSNPLLINSAISVVLVVLGGTIAAIVWWRRRHKSGAMRRAAFVGLAAASPLLLLWIAYGWRWSHHELGRAKFEELCRTQAMENIFRVVEGVDGFLVMKRRERDSSERYKRTGVELGHDQFGMEDPYGYDRREAESPETYFLYDYEFVEFKASGQGRDQYFRIHREKTGRTISSWKFRPDLPERQLDTYRTIQQDLSRTKSLYGYEWNEIAIDGGREHWIAGSETVVRDLRTNEILAVRRGFIFAEELRVRDRWGLAKHVRGRTCPQILQGDVGKVNLTLIRRVLKPKSPRLEYLVFEDDHGAYK